MSKEFGSRKLGAGPGRARHFRKLGHLFIAGRDLLPQLASNWLKSNVLPETNDFLISQWSRRFGSFHLELFARRSRDSRVPEMQVQSAGRSARWRLLDALDLKVECGNL